MKYKIVRTDKADEGVRRIILYIAQNFGENAALEALDEMEKSIHALTENPYLGTTQKYMLLKRQGYRILVTKKDLVFYKVNEEAKEVVIYAVTDQRQDYLNIIRGL